MYTALDGDEESIDNSLLIAEKCNLDFGDSNYKLPVLENDLNYDGIREFADKSLSDFIANDIVSSKDKLIYQERIDHELKIIEKWDSKDISWLFQILRKYAKKNSIPVGPGRGDLAGSLIAYLLGITEVDPIKHGLIFERF